MEIESSYARQSIAGVLQLLPDPIIATPPLALNLWHVLHPTGDAWRFVRLGPVTCIQPEPQKVTLACWGWCGSDWVLLHDNVDIRAQLGPTAVSRADAQVLRVPRDYGPVTALCVLPRWSIVATGDYRIYFAGIATPRWPC